MLVSGVQQSDSVIHIHVAILFQILFPFRLLHNIEQSSLCYTVGPCLLIHFKYSSVYMSIPNFLQLMNLHWHLIVNQSPQFTLEFTLGIVHFMGLDKCIMTCTHHYGIIQSIFTALKVLCALPIHSSPSPPNLWQPMIFLLSS